MTKIKDILLGNKTISNITETELNDNVLIIDGTNRYKSCFIRASELSDNGYYVGGYVAFLKSLSHIIRTLAPSRVIIVFDGSGGSVRRKKMYSGYKANRLKIKKYNREMSSDGVDEEESMLLQFKRLLDYLYNLPVTIITLDNIEADDVIAYIKTNTNYKKCMIVSSDKDFYQLIETDKCVVYDPINKKIVNYDTLIDTYKCSPNNFIYYKALLGDTSDNIKGVQGIGKKTIESKFGCLALEDRIDISDFHDYLDDKTFTKLNNDIDTFSRNIELMDLTSTIIDNNSAYKIRNFFNDIKYSYELDANNIKRYVINDGITKSFFQLDKWILDSFSRLNYIISKK